MARQHSPSVVYRLGCSICATSHFQKRGNEPVDAASGTPGDTLQQLYIIGVQKKTLLFKHRLERNLITKPTNIS